MRVVRISVRDFRAYDSASAELGAGLTVITGPNGAGKTNLIEALYFGCTGRSCRTSNEREVVRFGQRATRVVVDAVADDGPHELTVGFSPGRPSGCGSTAPTSSGCSTRRSGRCSACSCPTDWS